MAKRVRGALSNFAEIELLRPLPHLPDMVFTANAGLVREDAFIPSHFKHPERHWEETQMGSHERLPPC